MMTAQPPRYDAPPPPARPPRASLSRPRRRAAGPASALAAAALALLAALACVAALSVCPSAALAQPDPLNLDDTDTPNGSGDEDSDDDEDDGEDGDDKFADDPEATLVNRRPFADPAANDQVGIYQRGYSWGELGGGRFYLELSAVATNPNRPREIFLATQNQVFVSRNGGKTWELAMQALAAGALTGTQLGAGTLGGFDADGRRDELIEERTEERYRELRDELRDELLGQFDDESIVEDLLDDGEDDLRQSAQQDVLANDLDAIDAQVRQEAAEAAAGAGAGGPQSDALDLSDGGELEDDSGDDSDPTTVATGVIDITRQIISDLVVHPTKPDLLFVATQNGLFRNSGPKDDFNLVIQRPILRVAATAKSIYIGTVNGLLQSTDDGASWYAVNGVLGIETIFAMDASGPYLYAAGPTGMFASSDRGLSWSQTSLPAALASATITDLAIDPKNPRRVLIGSSIGVFVSDDGGRSVEALGRLGLNNFIIRDVAWHPTLRGLAVVATAGGVFATGNGKTWANLYDGLTSLDVRRVAIIQSDTSPIVALTSQAAQIFVPSGDLIEREELLRALRERWRKEPSITALIAAAIRVNRTRAGDWRGWRSSAELQPVLPTISGSLVAQQRRNERDQVVYQLFGGDVTRTRFVDRTPENLQWSVVALWDLNALFYNVNTQRAAAQTRQQRRLQRAIVQRLLRLYTSRRNLMLQYALGKDKTVAERIRLQLQIDELGAQMTALTDASFDRGVAP